MEFPTFNLKRSIPRCAFKKWQQPQATKCPYNIFLFINTTLAWDNIDRLEETLSGEGTSHRVNGIAVQANHFIPHLPSASTPTIMKSNRKSIESVGDATPSIYNAGERCGPHCRDYVEIRQIMENSWKKKILWILERFLASEKQAVPGWTGFNISVRNEQEVAKDSGLYFKYKCPSDEHVYCVPSPD